MALLAVGLVACAGPQSTFPFDDYLSMRTHFGELYQNGSLQEAAELMEAALPRFPDHLEANAFNLAIVYSQLGEPENGMKVLKFAHDRGVWFNIYGFRSPLFNPYRALNEFDAVVARNDSLRLVAQSTSAPDLKVVLPDGYSADREYPLFLALHGGGGNMEDFSMAWKSDLLTEEYIVAYVQSSLMVSMTGYSWSEDFAISRQEVADAYHEIVDDYAINSDEVVVGGFSAGGTAALEVVLGNNFPIAGFVALCPVQPEGLSAETVAVIRDRGVRGTILTTEMDPNVESQREMVELLKETQFPHEFVVTPNVGHWIPDNLGELIDRAIMHIRVKRGEEGLSPRINPSAQ